jgi:ATP-dependent DNA helicase RecG
MRPLNDLLRLEEGKTIEFKRDLSSSEKVLKTLVGFGNGAGGTLVIGVNDGDRTVAGLEDPRLEEERLANLIATGIEPQLMPEIAVVPWRRTHVLVAEVYPGPARPYWVKSIGFPVGVIVRIGSTNRVADPAQIDELRRIVLRKTFDEEPLIGTSSEALDFRVASELFSGAGRKLRRADLESLGLLASVNGRTMVTAAGMILFGKDRKRQFPDAYVKAGYFEGKHKSHIIDSAEIHDPLPGAVTLALRFVQRNLRQGVEIKGLKSRLSPEIPEIALREAIINATVHTNYAQRGSPLRVAVFDDRVEIDSPGGLSPGMTLSDMRNGISKLRNPIIARVFRELGLMEQWGSGVQRMFEACLTAGLLPPKIEETGGGLRVTLYRKSTGPVQLSDQVDKSILDLLARQPGRTTAELAPHIRLSVRATSTRLARLVGQGLIVVIGKSLRDPRRAYFLAGTESALGPTDG